MKTSQTILNIKKGVFFATVCISVSSVLPSKVFGQNTVKGIYTTQNGFCSASYLFLPGGLFYYEGGCEDRSSILKGAYKISADSVQLFVNNSPLSYSIRSTGTNIGKERTIKVVDVEGEPLINFKVFALPTSLKKDTLESVQILVTDSSGILKLDTKQTAAISFDRYSTLRIDKSNQFTWIALVKMEGSVNVVQFNYHRFCLKYPQINVAMSLSNLKRQVANDALIDDKQNIFTKSKN